LRASYDLARVGSDINTGDKLIVASQFILQLEAIARALVKLDIILLCNSKRWPVRWEGMVGDGIVKEVVYLWSDHYALR
jgi:hypothetical protein